MAKKEKQELTLQQAYMELQQLSQGIKQSQEQIQQITAQLEDLNATEQALDDIPNSEIDSELLVPMSAGIFVKAGLKENKKVVINVGAGTAVEKDIADTKELVLRQKQELTNIRDQLAEQMQLMNARLHAIQHAVEKAGIAQ
ncbi:prefoldin subunit alpha [Candidatus Woesearchaeota archaeon]|nr:prefoldin subunit alpha [Candidatus Woesearchaeota archaeon]MBW3014153.1 prefoldin subunit alpha [Candidatus Woesearchaeota archaeon]